MSATSRPFLRCLLAAFVAAAAMPAGAARAADALVVAVNRDDPPFGFTDAAGQLTGFSVEIARALCAAMAVPCRLEPTRIQEVLAGVAEGRFDFAVANLLRTAERETMVDFTERYFRSSSAFVGRPGAVAGVAPAQIAGRAVAVTAGSVQERWLRATYGDSVKVAALPTPAEAMGALADGRADLMLAPTLAGFGFLTSPAGTAFEIIGEPIHDQGLGGDVAIPLPKGRDDLRQRLNGAIAAIQRDGAYDRIALRYFPFRVR